jgi:4,4'-diaponeurosporenoate glycosyltransferase
MSMPWLETVSVVLRLLAGCWLLWRIARPGPVAPGFVRPACSIVVPARDEAHVLPDLLASVLPQLGARDELVIVDDHSTDGTASVARAAGAQLVEAPDLPEGWTGKALACATGATAARNDTLVFLDADVRVLAGGLDRVLSAHAREVPDGLLSVQPHHEVRRPYERLSALFNVVAMMGTDAFTPFGLRRRPAGAFGPCLVTTRDAYASVGGHASVASAVLDDVALAKGYQRAGRRVVCLGGRGALSFRMYPSGVRQLVEGWSKNLAGGADAARRITVLLVVAWVSVLIQAAWWFGRLAATGSGPGGSPWFAVAVYAAVVAQLVWMLRRVGTFGWITALFYPVPLVFFLAVFVRSAFLTVVRRKVPWKGRELRAPIRRGA